ncbi:hypothetical protein [Sphingomonas sp.]|uniref:hypothetical protein n=1 Tax=Sphingomonas sp. TaxID=28214 RepID=UPI003B3B6E3F
MRKLLPILACLMLVLTGWSGMAHAAEAAGGRIGSVAFTVHMPGDGDEVPGDSDNALPHHHGGCHGHDVGAPIIAPPPTFYCVDKDAAPSCASPILAAISPGVAARPPQA